MTTVEPTPIEKEMQPAHGTRCAASAHLRTDSPTDPMNGEDVAPMPFIPARKWHPSAVGIIEIPPSNKSK